MGWVQKNGIGGEAGGIDRSTRGGGSSSMHDNQLLSVQFFKRRVGPWLHSGSMSDTGLRWAIDPTSSTAQGLLLQRSARNLNLQARLFKIMLSALSVVRYTCFHSHWVFFVGFV